MAAVVKPGRREGAVLQPLKAASIALLPPVSFFAQHLQPIALGRDVPPLLQVIIDAEEEFDWSHAVLRFSGRPESGDSGIHHS